MKSPTLLLKPSAYKSNKLYSVLPDNGDGDFSIYSSTSSRTRVDSGGVIKTISSGVPRVDYFTGYGSAMFEPTRTNYVDESVDLSGWTLSHASASFTFTADSGIAPDGSMTAFLFDDKTASTGTLTNYVTESYSINDASNKQALSFFVKFDKTDKIAINITSGGTSTISSAFVLSKDGSITNPIATGIDSYSVDKYSDGWFRVKVIGTPSVSDTTILLEIGLVDIDSGGQIYTGSFFLWGIQLEEGPSVTSYIPTSGASVQRVYDSLRVSNLSANNIITFGHGSVLFDFEYNGEVPDADAVYQMSIGVTGGIIGIAAYTTGSLMRAVVDNSSDSTVNLSTGRNKVLFNIYDNSVEIWVNGVLEATNTITTAALGDGVLSLNGSSAIFRLYELSIFNQSLNSDECKKITQ